MHLVSTATPRSFPARLLLSRLGPRLDCCTGLFCPMCRTLHLFFMNLSGFCCPTPRIRNGLVLPHAKVRNGLVLSHLTHQSRPLILYVLRVIVQMLDDVNPSITLGTSLVISLLLTTVQSGGLASFRPPICRFAQPVVESNVVA